MCVSRAYSRNLGAVPSQWASSHLKGGACALRALRGGRQGVCGCGDGNATRARNLGALWFMGHAVGVAVQKNTETVRRVERVAGCVLARGAAQSAAAEREPWRGQRKRRSQCVERDVTLRDASREIIHRRAKADENDSESILIAIGRISRGLID